MLQRQVRAWGALVSVWVTPSYPAGEWHRTGGEGAEATTAVAARCAEGCAGRSQGCAGCSTLGGRVDPAAAQGILTAPRCHPRRQLHCRDASCGASSPQTGRLGKGATPPGCSPPHPAQMLPSTLVRVRTGLLQALSGATRAECFFMVSCPPAGAGIAYILGPAERPRCQRPPRCRSARLAAQALPRLPAVLLSPRSLRGLPRGAHLPSAQPLHARTASRLEVAANSDVTAKCAPHAHPGSPAPPPPGTPMPQLVPPLEPGPG